MIPRLRLCSYATALLVALAGCGSTERYDRTYYVLSADRPAVSARSQTDYVLDVSRFTIDSAYSGSGLVCRVGESEYESDFYNEFLAAPAAMITDKTRNWLSRSRLFRRVLDPGSRIDSTHVIEGNVTALYGDFRDRSSPKAVIAMRVFLLKAEAGREPLAVFGKTYRSSVAIESEGPEALVEALGRCLQGILSALENDLAERLENSTQSPSTKPAPRSVRID
ncbi:MAG: ABC-type transport auxiliary lipoprotein family protein [Sedimentisphaerales bacterium]|jgi:cholesterol transport system auxiliary component